MSKTFFRFFDDGSFNFICSVESVFFGSKVVSFWKRRIQIEETINHWVFVCDSFCYIFFLECSNNNINSSA